MNVEVAGQKKTSLDVTFTTQTAYLCATLALTMALHLSVGSKSTVHPKVTTGGIGRSPLELWAHFRPDAKFHSVHIQSRTTALRIYVERSILLMLLIVTNREARYENSLSPRRGPESSAHQPWACSALASYAAAATGLPVLLPPSAAAAVAAIANVVLVATAECCSSWGGCTCC